jgi:ribosomal protein S19
MKKQIYLDKFMLRKSFRSNLSKLEEVKLWTKKSKITSCFNIGSRFQMYNGSKFVNLTLERDMQGYTMGNFALQSVLLLQFIIKDQKLIKVRKKNNYLWVTQ